MDVKRSRKSKKDVVDVLQSPARSEAVSTRSFGSPDLPPGSQECFKVGWDWSLESNQQNPKIKYVKAAPKTTSRGGYQRLQCLRPRRLVPNDDPAMCDASLFINDLKSLASGLNKSSATSTSSSSQSDVPTNARAQSNILDCDLLQSEKKINSVVDSENKSSPTASSLNEKDPSFQSNNANSDFLNDLLEDSMCEEIVKCTQELESKLCNSKTPVQSDSKRSSGIKKKLSLSLKKKTSSGQTVCRKLESHVTESSSSTRKALQVEALSDSLNKESKIESLPLETVEFRRNSAALSIKEDKKTRSSSSAQFDECDDLLLSCFQNEEREDSSKVCKKQRLASTSVGNQSEGVKNDRPAAKSDELQEAKEESNTLLDSDDFLVSPDVLGILDLCERNATQEYSASQSSSTTTTTISRNYEKTNDPVERVPNHSGACDKELIVGQKPEIRKYDSTRAKYTPEEIERKRQEAIRKRLSLKKKSC